MTVRTVIVEGCGKLWESFPYLLPSFDSAEITWAMEKMKIVSDDRRKHQQGFGGVPFILDFNHQDGQV
eukprot:1150334-Pelagomonas_calceolata.AAC.2